MLLVPEASVPAVEICSEIRRRDDQLRQADAVVRDKHHLQLVTNIRIWFTTFATSLIR